MYLLHIYMCDLWNNRLLIIGGRQVLLQERSMYFVIWKVSGLGLGRLTGRDNYPKRYFR